MNWRSEHIWIERRTPSRKRSNFCFILFLGSLGLVGTSLSMISFFPSQQIIFFPQFYGIAGLVPICGAQFPGM